MSNNYSGHAPGHVRDTFLEALEAFQHWNGDGPEPMVDFEVNYVPRKITISAACGVVWNLLLDNSDDVKALSKADGRCSAAEAGLDGVADALVAARNRVAALRDQLSAERDRIEREVERARVEKLIAEIEKCHAALARPIQDLLAALREGKLAETAGVAAWLENVDGELSREIPAVTGVLRSMAPRAENSVPLAKAS